MTQEDKELLLKDLCARLPYGVIVDYKENEFETPHWKITTINPETMSGWIGYDKRIGAGSESGSRPFKIGEVRPYLRPMSSMTQEEIDEYDTELDKDMDIVMDGALDKDRYITSDGKHNFSKNFVPHFGNDWLDKNMFDYRGLIEKDLAVEAPEGMYK